MQGESLVVSVRVALQALQGQMFGHHLGRYGPPHAGLYSAPRRRHSGTGRGLRCGLTTNQLE
jgi:hypothetical protein